MTADSSAGVSRSAWTAYRSTISAVRSSRSRDEALVTRLGAGNRDVRLKPIVPRVVSPIEATNLPACVLMVARDLTLERDQRMGRDGRPMAGDVSAIPRRDLARSNRVVPIKALVLLSVAGVDSAIREMAHAAAAAIVRNSPVP